MSRQRCFSTVVFDRKAKSLQRSRAAVSADAAEYDYLKEEIGHRLCSRLYDLKDRRFPLALDLGAGPGYLRAPLAETGLIDTLIERESSFSALHRETDKQLGAMTVRREHGDEEVIGLPDASLDLLVSNCALHWINDLPGVFAQARHVLKPDGFFLASMFGEDTLFELRTSLLLAEQERRGGVAQHMSPFAGVGDVGNLLTRVGFALPAVDIERVVVRYSNMFALLRDLKGMGESNAGVRRMANIPRETLVAAAGIYAEMFPAEAPDDVPEERGIEASFNVIYVAAWAPAASQQKPAKRGSQTKSIGDV